MSQPPVPQRIGDAERDAAVTRLRDAMEQGRITMAEFDERSDTALRARTQADLDPLFLDLPATGVNASATGGSTAVTAVAPWGTAPAATPMPSASGPSGETANLADQPQAPRWAYVLNAIAWPLTIILCFAFGWHKAWWLMLIPSLLLGPLVRAVSGVSNRQQSRELHQQRREQRRQLRG